MKFTVTYINKNVQIYKLQYPMCSPSIICQTNFLQEYTVYKYVSEDDELFKK